MKVGVIGTGAIGRVVAERIRDGLVPDAVLTGVVHAEPVDPPNLPVVDLPALLADAELVVECAGQAALAELGPRVLGAGRDLLVVSVGALADQGLLDRLLAAGQGCLHLSTGAIGGLDLLRAAAAMGTLRSVRIVTTKLPTTLIQPWMPAEQVADVRAASGPVELLRGPAREVTAAFPKSANVAASVAIAVGSWDLVEAVVVADPAATLTSHVITAEGEAGSYRFEVRNNPSPTNPASSGVVAYAVLNAISALARPRVVFR